MGVGYFSVSFGFGAVAAVQGIRALDAMMISLTNVTSAGQFAGVTLIATGATLWEIVLTMIVVNSRYGLMSLALGQRLGPEVGILPRMAVAFFNTDEIFALVMAERMQITPSFVVGVGMMPVLGWTGGTLLGALAGAALPAAMRTALGVVLYGMFIAVVAPVARREHPVLIAVILALICSCLFDWVPVLKSVSSGISIVVCTVVASAVCAVLFPVKDEEGLQ